MTAPALSSPIRPVCPACRTLLDRSGEWLTCPTCRLDYPLRNGVPELFLSREADQATGRVQALYDHVAHDYDEVFSSHVTEHYLRKRTTLVNELLPSGGSVLDVGCGTGALAGRIQRLGFDVVGVDASAGMLAQALEHGVGAVYAAYSTALPFEDGSFDLALSVATMHHLETAERVAATIAEMGRVVRSGGHVLVWDHNPLNPYWPILMRRVPQDHGDERLVSVWEVLEANRAAGLRPECAARMGLVPDFMPRGLMPFWRRVEAMVEANPVLSLFAAHNVVIARKP
ncbi:MAG TPA: methyltransferase domain-containing protein [Chloroflexota bacterium]|nr:methyltransferase domain-containing protein [Chloroflexota bacterium]